MLFCRTATSSKMSFRRAVIFVEMIPSFKIHFVERPLNSSDQRQNQIGCWVSIPDSAKAGGKGERQAIVSCCVSCLQSFLLNHFRRRRFCKNDRSTKWIFDVVTFSTKWHSTKWIFDEVTLTTKWSFDEMAFDQMDFRRSDLFDEVVVRRNGIRRNGFSTK